MLLLLAQTVAAAPSTALIWGIVLLGLAVLLLLIEAFVPAGGLIGVLAVVSAITGLVLITWSNTVLGLIATLLTLIAAPVLVMLMLKYAPDMPITRLMSLGNDGISKTDPASEAAPAQAGGPSAQLRPGDTGQALTALRPMGTCRIRGRTLECTAQDAMIEPDTPVTIRRIDGHQVWVSPA